MKENRGVKAMDDDFKIGDEIEESGEYKESKSKNIIPIVIIVVIALVCGLTVFFITNALFGKKEVNIIFLIFVYIFYIFLIFSSKILCKFLHNDVKIFIIFMKILQISVEISKISVKISIFKIFINLL